MFVGDCKLKIKIVSDYTLLNQNIINNNYTNNIKNLTGLVRLPNEQFFFFLRFNVFFNRKFRI